MCGIAGVVSSNSSFISGIDTKAINCLNHRGPAGEGYWINEDKTVYLGHKRLSIIDLSPAAGQPMHYLNRYIIVHNGEIYNYPELRAQLQQKGYAFYTTSDTEVILAAYAAYGKHCLQYLDGMFAFVIWDRVKQTLFAARDRFGEKPLFFFFDEEKMAFASEMKALWQMGIPKEVNRSMLYNFLSIGYTCNPSDPAETFYLGIEKLPPASFLTYSLKDNKAEVEKYWQLSIDVKPITQKDAVDRFQHYFFQSISRRLRSDVAIGTSLSGGLDSSSVVAFCDKQSSEHYTHKSFTVGFEGYEKDETAFAALVAKKFGLQHYTTTVKEEEVVELMKHVMQHQEEPFLSASVLAQYKVYQLAKEKGVTVLLDGQGADEILAGYHKYYKWYWQELYKEKRLKKSGELKAAKQLSLPEAFGLKNKIAALFPDFAASVLEGRKEKKAYKSSDLERDFAFSNKRNLYYTTPLQFTLNGALYYNTVVNGLEELLRLADRNSMAHSTEVRLPFLDHKLVEFLFTLPPELKIHKGWTKWLLRKATEDMLPREITWRKDKVGFEPPQKQWMMNQQVSDAIQEGKKKLVNEKILSESVLSKKIQPKEAHAAESNDWKYWSASFLFNS